MDETGRGLVALTDIVVTGLELPAQRNKLTAVCADLLDVQAVSLMTLDSDGALELAAASEETAELLTRFELAYDQGPGVDAYRTGERVSCDDLTAARLRWPRFAPVALDAGVAATFGLPCKLWDDVIGAMILYMNAPRPMSDDSVEFSQNLVNTVSLGVTAHRGRELAVRAAQLQGALDSRIMIEQAKGMLAERTNVTVDEAFALLRDYSRRTGSKMRHVAQDVVKGVLTLPADN